MDEQTLAEGLEVLADRLLDREHGVSVAQIGAEIVRQWVEMNGYLSRIAAALERNEEDF